MYSLSHETSQKLLTLSRASIALCQVAPTGQDSFHNHVPRSILITYLESSISTALSQTQLVLKKSVRAELADTVNQSVQRIHFHGLDVEMANLTVEQPSIKVLKVEIHHGLKVERIQNGSANDYTTT